jgi:hypothetical protein
MAQRDLANILAGPCSLTLDGVDLGHTEGETRLLLTPLLRERTVDAYGRTPVDFIHLGTDVRLETRLAEWTLATLEKLFPLGSSESGYLGIGTAPGASLRDAAKTLTLHPLELGAGDTSRDVTFWKAVAAGAVETTFSNETDRVFQVTFRILPDLTKDDGEWFGRIGAS